MKNNIVTVFANCAAETFQMMAMTECIVELPETPLPRKGKVSGVIALQGKDLEGRLIVNFEKSAILLIASNMLGEEYTELNEEILDCVGEMTNIICGSSKPKLQEVGFDLDMASPTVIHGDNLEVTHPKGLEVQFAVVKTPSGAIFIESSLGAA